MKYSDDCQRKHLGARNELVACAWLLDRGYEVYRNVSPHGGVDIIALKGEERLLLDVKSRRFKVSGKLAEETKLNPGQIVRGVKILYVCEDGNCLIADSRANEKKVCVNCGDSFLPRTFWQKYCSQRVCKDARMINWKNKNAAIGQMGSA